MPSKFTYALGLTKNNTRVTLSMVVVKVIHTLFQIFLVRGSLCCRGQSCPSLAKCFKRASSILLHQTFSRARTHTHTLDLIFNCQKLVTPCISRGTEREKQSSSATFVTLPVASALEFPRTCRAEMLKIVPLRRTLLATMTIVATEPRTRLEAPTTC